MFVYIQEIVRILVVLGNSFSLCIRKGINIHPTSLRKLNSHFCCVSHYNIVFLNGTWSPFSTLGKGIVVYAKIKFWIWSIEILKHFPFFEAVKHFSLISFLEREKGEGEREKHPCESEIINSLLHTLSYLILSPLFCFYFCSTFGAAFPLWLIDAGFLTVWYIGLCGRLIPTGFLWKSVT